MDFEWDAKKSEVNEEKHGISFEQSTAVFLDSMRVEWEDSRDYGGERRFVTIGLVSGEELALTYTVRQGTIRIISARKATRHERKEYWAG